MLKFIYKFLLPYRNKKNKMYYIWNKIISKFIQVYIPLYYKITKNEYGLNIYIKRKRKIIISLTTIPSRVEMVSLCIEGLLRQTVKPDKIILWLSEEEFKTIKLNKELLNQRRRGLEICYCDDNLKAHKKYYYTMKEYPKDIVITVDDDVYYPEDLIENLMKTYRKNKTSVICYAAHEITFKKNNQVDNYKNWNALSPGITIPSHLLMAVGFGGILYPLNCLNSNFLDKEKLKSLCFYGDDLWLKVMELLNNTKVKKVNKYTKCWVQIPNTQRKALWKYNVVKHNNDKQLKILLNEYNIDLKFYSNLDEFS